MGFIFKGEYVYTVKDIYRNTNGTVVALSLEFAFMAIKNVIIKILRFTINRDLRI